MSALLTTTCPTWRTSRINVAVIAILFTSIILHPTTIECSECPSSYYQSNCTCDRIGLNKYDLLCPRSRFPYNSYVLKADIEEPKQASLSCNIIKSPADLTLVSGLNVGPVDTFNIKLCPLPDISFRELMQSMGITQVKKLQIQLVSNFSVLERRHLEDLHEVTQLDLSSTGLSDLPEDLFRDMSNLSWLTVINNNISHLSKGNFKYVPKLDVLDLGNNNITYLEPGVFQNLSQLRLLNLWNNRIANLTRSVFSDTPNLEKLDLRSNSLVTFTPDVFTDLAKLNKVNILGNKISSLPSALFSSNPSLEIFTIMYNKRVFMTIPQGLLSNLTSLKEVNLSSNNITNIPKDIIWGSPAIRNIFLNGNLLEELPADLFRDSKEVVHIDISNNRLRMLPNTIFVSTRKVKTLIAHHNQLTYISRDLMAYLSDIETIDFSYNKLTQIDGEAFIENKNLLKADFSNNFLSLYDSTDPFASDIFGASSPFKNCKAITKLYLSNNQITQIFSDWLRAANLTILDLRNNEISYLETRDLHFSSKQKLSVDLSHNKISVINLLLIEDTALYQYEGVIKPHYQNPLENHSARINVAGNPLQCDCRNYYLKKYFNGELTPEVNYIIDIESSNLTCAGPESLKGMSFKEISSKLFMCPLVKILPNVKCPEKCECFYQPVSEGFIIDCNNKNLINIPESLFTTSQLVLKSLNHKVNHTELDLSDNYISALPKNLGDGFKNVTKLILSSNNITTIDITQLSPNITELRLDNNNISNLDSNNIKFLKEAEQLKIISLSNNPWQCDCKSKDLLSFIQHNYEKIDMLHNITCIGGKSMSLLTPNDICPFSKEAVIISSTILAVLGITIGILYGLYCRYNQEIKVWLYAHQLCLWFVTEEELDRDKTYDAFISYSHQDEEFVIKHLVPELENGVPNFKLCLHYRDWIVGDYIPTQIARSVENSRRTIVILSPNFLESVWGKMEFKTAHSQALSEGRARVIVILYGDIGPTDDLDPELKAYISMNTYIKWGDPRFWDRLKFALPHPPKEPKGIPLFQNNLVSQQNRPTLYIDKDSLIKEKDPNATPPVTTTPPANSFIDQMPSFIPNGQLKSEENSESCAKIKY